jgi:hypothetical protein
MNRIIIIIFKSIPLPFFKKQQKNIIGWATYTYLLYTLFFMCVIVFLC